MQDAVNSRTLTSNRVLPDVIGLGGALAGLLAGAVMVVLSPVLSLINGITTWEPPRLIASTVLGPSVLARTDFELQPILVALLLHMLVSLVLGIIFGVVVNRLLHLTTDFGLPLYIGLAYGIIVFFIAYFVILPIANPQISERYIGAGVAQNVTFGLVLGLFYTFLRPRPYRYTDGE